MFGKERKSKILVKMLVQHFIACNNTKALPTFGNYTIDVLQVFKAAVRTCSFFFFLVAYSVARDPQLHDEIFRFLKCRITEVPLV
jgi:hypothetical protein